jgi:hypothetical protein
VRAVVLLCLLAIAGAAAGAGLGSPPTRAPACKPTAKRHCPKPKARTVTVTRTHTVTSVATTIQTVTAAATQTVTSTLPFLVPRIGDYHGALANGLPITFAVGVRQGGYTIQRLQITGRFDLSCITFFAGGDNSGTLPLDASGRVNGALSQSGRGTTITTTVSGGVSGGGHASGTVTLGYSDPGRSRTCSSDPVAWSASL